VLGILALILSFLTLFDIPLIVLGVVFSVLGLQAARRGAGGKGMAIAGLSCAIIGAIVAATLFIIVYNRAKDCADRFDSGTSAYQTCLRVGVKG
jgi:TctA family transporter